MDYPNREPITGDDERIGARNYVAPELREFAEHKPADKADVYSLAKSFWVIASGRPVPPDHQLRQETRDLRLSTHCPHEYSSSLDHLLHRSTEYEPNLRPTMKEFAHELSEWLKLGDISSSASPDLSVLAKECRDIIERQMTTDRSKENLMKEAGPVSKNFDSILDTICMQIKEITGLTAKRVHLTYENKTGRPEVFGAASVISKHGEDIQVVLKVPPREISFKACVLFELLSDRRIHIAAGYSDHPLFPWDALATHTWKKEIVAYIGSAELMNQIESLKAQLLDNLPQAIQAFVARIKCSQAICS